MTGRTLTAAVAAALEDREGAPRWLVEIEFDSGTTRFWSGLGDLAALGVVWSGVGRLGKIEAISEISGAVATGVAMELSIMPTPEIPDAVDTFLNIALGETYQGRPCRVYQAQLNPTTGALIDDPFLRFRGYIDIMEDMEIPGGATIRVTAENRLIDLERPKKRTYTPEDQKEIYPNDTFFDGVVTLQRREIVLQ